MAKLLLSLAVLAMAAVAVTAASNVLYTRTTVPTGWTMGGLADPEAPVEFTLALKQRNLDILDKWFWEASDPTHKNYQEFKTIDEIRDLVSPKPEEALKVSTWLKSAGVHLHGVKNFGDAMDVATKVKHAVVLFNTKFYEFKHAETGAVVVRQFGSYSVPDSVSHLIDFVSGVSAFPIPHLTAIKSQNKKTMKPATTDYLTVPQTLFNLYSITQESRKLIAGATYTSQSVIEFQGQDFAPSDLAAFGQGVNEPVQAVPASQIIGPNVPSTPGVEPSLDIQMVAGVNLKASNWFWLENGNGWLYQFGVHFFSTENVPTVNSISYGWWEGDQCTIAQDECSQLGVDSTGYVQRVNVEFQKIGLRGISLLSASGDSGANGRTNSDCSIPQLRAAFPSSSPYITSVGATELNNPTTLSNQPPACSATGTGLNCAASGTEQAVSYALSNFASGGGFSNIAAMPAYQQSAVQAYFASGVALPPATYYNATGRGAPDVAAAGHNIITFVSGAPQPVGGTSAASPIFAAVAAMLNDAEMSVSGKPLGFLNPFLYQMYAAEPGAFNDITVGDNKCTEDGCSTSCQGYLCAKGWDPVTGLGTPNYAVMRQYILAGRSRMNKRQ